jgi:hypothetical protein
VEKILPTANIGRWLLSTAAKLGMLKGCVAEGETKLTLDVMLKRPVRRPLFRIRGTPVLLLVALLPVSGSRGMKAMKIRPMLVVVAVAVWMLVATRPTSVTTKVRVVLILGKMSRGQQR